MRHIEMKKVGALALGLIAFAPAAMAQDKVETSLVSSASREGRRIIAVTLDAPDDWNDHKKMLEEGFSQYRVRRVLSKGQVQQVNQII